MRVSKVAYTAALRAKVLDCLRGLLPAGALTNMGIYGNGRFFESAHPKASTAIILARCKISEKTLRGAVQRSCPLSSAVADPNSKYALSLSLSSYEQMKNEIKMIYVVKHTALHKMRSTHPGIRLITYDPESPFKGRCCLLFANCDNGLTELSRIMLKPLPEEESIAFSIPAHLRENRRQKSPRALEHASFTFEIVADFGAFRDLHRHRLLTQERQLLTCDYGYYIPPEILGPSIENEYCEAIYKAKEVYDVIAKELPEEAQYIVPMAYNVRWYFHINFRALQWLCELRSSPAGHPNYRYIAKQFHKR